VNFFSFLEALCSALFENSLDTLSQSITNGLTASELEHFEHVSKLTTKEIAVLVRSISSSSWISPGMIFLDTEKGL
jgi:hypothetical protein